VPFWRDKSPANPGLVRRIQVSAAKPVQNGPGRDWKADSMQRQVFTGTRIRLIAGAACTALLAVGGVLVASGPAGAAGAAASAGSTAPRLHVSGNKLVNARGQRVVLRGVDRSGGEYACVQGFGIWDGPMNQAAVTAMKKWDVNAVRVPLNEACWNGQSYVKSADRGPRYRRAVQAYVKLLNRNGIVAILDLHWTDGAYTGPSSACSSARALCQKPMPDAAEAIPFWRSVARTFTGNNSVIFDLFNEPYPEIPAASESAGWRCWLRGGSCAGISYRVAGMQSLVTAVRSTGARNVIMAGGLAWANDLTQWLAHKPADPDHNIVASWHSYNFNTCDNRSCWAAQIAPVIKKVPVIVGELGENDCADGYVGPLMKWLDARSASYLAWAWNADFSCGSGPSLISNYDGAPTGFGRGVRAHLRSVH
jgi:endoglucanase